MNDDGQMLGAGVVDTAKSAASGNKLAANVHLFHPGQCVKILSADRKVLRGSSLVIKECENNTLTFERKLPHGIVTGDLIMLDEWRGLGRNGEASHV